MERVFVKGIKSLPIDTTFIVSNVFILRNYLNNQNIS